MQNFHNYSQAQLTAYHLKNSSLSFLPSDIKNIKITNNIRGFYKDKILKDFVYISSTGVDKDFFLRRSNNNFSVEFISYLAKNNSFSFINLNNYSIKYNRQFYKNFFKKKFFNSKLWKWKKSQQNHLKFSNSLNYTYFKKLLNIQKSKENNNLIFLKNTYKWFFFSNNNGFLIKCRPNFIHRSFFTSIIRILPWKLKGIIFKLLTLSYLILSFSNKFLNTANKTSGQVYSLLLYNLFFQHLNKYLAKLFKRKKLKVRKSNKVLNAFFVLTNKKYLWINNFVYNLINSPNNSKLVLADEVKNYSFSEKLNLFQKKLLIYQLYYSSINFNNKFDEYTFYKKELLTSFCNNLLTKPELNNYNNISSTSLSWKFIFNNSINLQKNRKYFNLLKINSLQNLRNKKTHFKLKLDKFFLYNLILYKNIKLKKIIKPKFRTSKNLSDKKIVIRQLQFKKKKIFKKRKKKY